MPTYIHIKCQEVYYVICDREWKKTSMGPASTPRATTCQYGLGVYTQSRPLGLTRLLLKQIVQLYDSIHGPAYFRDYLAVSEWICKLEELELYMPDYTS